LEIRQLRHAAEGVASSVVQQKSNPQAHAEKDGNGEHGDAGVLRLVKKLMPEVRVMGHFDPVHE
jgi:hypothetical protein